MNLAIAALIIVASAAAAIATLLIVRRRAPDGGYFHDGDRAAGVFGVLATGFAVLLGFFVFLAFESYDTSRTGAKIEALTVLQQVETSQFMPDPLPAELRGQLTCYARYVVHEEWPNMEQGKPNVAVNPWGIVLFETLGTVQPTSASEQAAYSKWLDQTSVREEARLDRVHGAEGVLPWPLWLGLLGMAGLIFVFMLFFADSGERAIVQALQIGSVVAVVVATLLVIRLLSHPYQDGPGSLQPVSMERTLEILGGEFAGVGTSGSIPCSENGLATS